MYIYFRIKKKHDQREIRVKLSEIDSNPFSSQTGSTDIIVKDYDSAKWKAIATQVVIGLIVSYLVFLKYSLVQPLILQTGTPLLSFLLSSHIYVDWYFCGDRHSFNPIHCFVFRIVHDPCDETSRRRLTPAPLESTAKQPVSFT